MTRNWIIAVVSGLVVIGLAVVAIYYARIPVRPAETFVRPQPQAPPDLARLRDTFTAGLDALHRNDGGTAVRKLASFNFRPRMVEQYRLYYLAGAYQQSGNKAAARRTLTELWQSNPRLAYGDLAALNLATMDAAAGAAGQAAGVCAALAARTDNPNVAAAARWQEITQRLAAGDIGGAVNAAKKIAVDSPRSPQAAGAIAFLRAVWSLGPADALHLTAGERLERAVCLLRDGDPGSALDELNVLEPAAPASLREPIILNRGLAQYQTHHFDDAVKTLEPLAGSAYRFAIPALYHLSKSYRILSSSIDPAVYKTITQKKKLGRVRVRVGTGKQARTVSRAKVAVTKRKVKAVDLAKKAKKDEYDRLATERLKDLLQLPLAIPVRVEVLNTLISVAESKHQDEYEQQLVTDLMKIAPESDSGLQHLWDEAWAAYERGDLADSRQLFQFLRDTYNNPNVKRQAGYWYARTIERLGDKEEALATYRQLASAPYLDVYGIFAVSRGASHQQNHTNPLLKGGPDWREIAERDMPEELRLAYELTALLDMRDARLEIVKNLRPSNNRFAQALLADYYSTTGDLVLMYRAAKQAFPQLATVEQDSAPAYFLKMYYPARYVDTIKRFASKTGVDPHLVMGLILQESYYNPNAKSHVGATGLMQLMPPTAKELSGRLHIPFGPARLTNPDVNIELGTLHLKILMNMFSGNSLLAIASYNAGQGNVLRWRRASRGKALDEFLESMPYAETRNYVKRVAILQSAYDRIAP